MPYCPSCGKEIEKDAIFCGNCGYQLAGKEETSITPSVERTDAISALRKGVNIISGKPIVLLPALIGAAISAILSFIAASYYYFLGVGILNMNFTPGQFGALFIGVVLAIIGGIISYIMTFASLDMSRDAYQNKNLDLWESVNYVLKRIWTFIVASILAAILAVTIILIPVVILMFVIMVVDEAGIKASLSQALKVFGNRLGDIIILIIIGIAGSAILGLIPYLGSILVAAFNVLIALAYIDIYTQYKIS